MKMMIISNVVEALGIVTKDSVESFMELGNRERILYSTDYMTTMI